MTTLAERIESELEDLKPCLAVYIDLQNRSINVNLVVGGNTVEEWPEQFTDETRQAIEENPDIVACYIDSILVPAAGALAACEMLEHLIRCEAQQKPIG